VLKQLNDGKNKQLVSLVSATTEEQQQGLDLGVRNQEYDLLCTTGSRAKSGSVKANLLPMLFLPLDLKQQLETGLKGAHALALALSAKQLNISSSNKRADCSYTASIEQDLTVPDTGNWLHKSR